MKPVTMDTEYFASRSNKDSETGCLNWARAVKSNGYGQAARGLTAHRGAWIAAHGPIPAGLMVCHKCDNRRCVNPAHLFLGTCRDNILDMRAKGRQFRPVGSSQGASKLKEHDVSIIKWCLDAGVTQDKLAKLYGVSQSVVSRLYTGRTWKHVKAMSMETR